MAAPVTLSCPNCRASIKVDGDTARTCTCDFCKASVYLPDDLWRILHPVKRAAPWSILFRGKVESHEDYREREAASEAARVQKLARDRDRAQQCEARRIEKVAREAEEEAARGDSRLRAVYWVVFVAILIMLTLAVLWFTLR